MKISVITPLYNGEKYVKSLCSMVEQNSIQLKKYDARIELEYILVNDSPTSNPFSLDDTPNYMLKKIQNEKNLGIHASRVAGILHAEGDYIYMLDQDDEIKDTFLVSQYRKIENNDVIVSNGYRKFQHKSIPLYKTRGAQALVNKKSVYFYGTDMILSPGQCLIRRSVIPKEWLEYILQVNGCDDFFLWILLFEKNAKFSINKEKLYYHTENGANYSASAQNMTSSYMSMCKLLKQKQLIPLAKVSCLVQRYYFKNNIKNEKRLVKKLLLVVKNFRVVIYTLIYKILGYH